MIDKITIYDTEHSKIRLGNKRDGGYVVLDEPLHNCDVLYSYGVDNDVSFETDFLNKQPNSKARLFDHTISRVPNLNEKFSFLAEGISPYPSLNLNTLENHLIKYGDLGLNKNKVLKMDVEWSEWEVLLSLKDSLLNEFSQIICEFHFIPILYNGSHSPYFTGLNKSIYERVNTSVYKMYNETIKKLCKLFFPYHMHVNNSLPLVRVGGRDVPQLLEISFVNKNIVNSPSFSTAQFPISSLDFPNKTDRPDVIYNQ